MQNENENCVAGVCCLGQLYFHWILAGSPSWISVTCQSRIGLVISIGLSSLHWTLVQCMWRSNGRKP